MSASSTAIRNRSSDLLKPNAPYATSISPALTVTNFQSKLQVVEVAGVCTCDAGVGIRPSIQHRLSGLGVGVEGKNSLRRDSAL